MKVFSSIHLLDLCADSLLFTDVNEIQAHYKQLLSDFKAAHQTTSDLRSKISSPEQLKNDIVAQEKEREQLLIKIDDLKKKITDMTVSDTRLTCWTMLTEHLCRTILKRLLK